MKGIIRSFYIITILMFVNTICLQNAALAKGGGGGGGSKIGLSAGVIALFGQGKMGNGSTNASGYAADRTMIYTPIGIFLGFNIKKFRIGAQYEYSMSGQSDDPSKFSGTNISGKNTSTGIRLEYYDGRQSFGVVYHLSDTYALDKEDANLQKVEYKGSGGISVQYMHQIKNKLGLVLDYSFGEYSDSLPTGKVKWNRMGAGIVFSNFMSKGK